MTSPVQTPADFVPMMAISFGAIGAPATPVTTDAPLPVREMPGAARSAAVTGTADAAATSAPFAPDLGRAVWITLSGAWSGRVQLLRSVDGGATRLPLTLPDGSEKGVWHGNANAIAHVETEAGALLFLDLRPAGGTIGYRVAQ